MYKNLQEIILIILLSLFLLYGCLKSNSDNNDKVFELDPLLSEEIVRSVSMEPGIRVDVMNLKGGVDWDYAISIPEIEANEKVPLVLALHWTDAGNEYIPYFNCLAEPGFRKLNAIIFAPSAGDRYFWDENNYLLILTLLEYAKTQWPIDEEKIIVSGYSNGGIATWFFGTDYAEYFSAAIPVGSRATEFDGKLKIPFYAIHGSHDNVFYIQDLENRIEELKELGSDIQLHVLEGYSHLTPCSYRFELANAADWVLNEVWK